MKPLYPAIKTYAQQMLSVDDTHSIYLEESGTPTGIPVLVVHGGPGGGVSPKARRYFDPERYRIILFDQRGCGQSTPLGNLKNNTTSHLLSDMETIRQKLSIEKWLLFGGSWGSTLSLLYAQKYPERVLGLIVRGICLAREQELQWFYQNGTRHVFPDYWEEFVLPIPEEEREDMVAAYYKRLTGSNEVARMHAAKHWAQWEAQCATLHPSKPERDNVTPLHVTALALLQTHYFINRCFLKPNQILSDMYKLAEIPGIIVHGRYDMICPFDNARTLHLAWPESELYAIRDAGHSSSEPGIVDALINATEKMAFFCGD